MLRRGGLAISSSRKALEKLADYLQREGADDLHIVIERTGWTRGAFVLPTGEIIGKQIANMPSADRFSGSSSSRVLSSDSGARSPKLIVVF